MPSSPLASETQLWQVISIDAVLADADPRMHGGLYDHRLELFDHFMQGRPAGVAYGKISKVLHAKRPGLFPVLDNYLRVLYRVKARLAAEQHNVGRNAVRYAFWAAIRDDVINPDNVTALQNLRYRLKAHTDPIVQRVAGLTDVRLLDIVSWGIVAHESAR
jgi:hypothetical protein